MQQPLVPTSVGELIDKITILKIKQEKFTDDSKLANVSRELNELERIWQTSKDASVDIADLHDQLKQINETLWEIEDKIRIKELAAEFDQEFIELARSVYYKNDTRADIKKKINLRTGSTLTEEKQYQDYQNN